LERRVYGAAFLALLPNGKGCIVLSAPCATGRKGLASRLRGMSGLRNGSSKTTPGIHTGQRTGIGTLPC
jgi:hypothetical protein